jgi:pimeloyl-ACP methyl ester carboxylesterase
MIRLDFVQRMRRAVASSYLEQHPAHTAAFVLIGAALATGALVGIAVVAGADQVVSGVARPVVFWVPVALRATVVS